MAKTVGRACAQIAILLTIFGSIQCAKPISSNVYKHVDTYLQYIDPVAIVPLPAEQLQRQRREAPAAPAVTPSPDQKNQYQSVNVNGTAAAGAGAAVGAAPAAGAAAAGKDASVKVDSKASGTYNVHNVGVDGAGQRKDYNVSSSSGSGSSDPSNSTTTINVAVGAAAAAPPPKKPLMSSTPKKMVSSSGAVPAAAAAGAAAAAAGAAAGDSASNTTSTITSTERPLIDDVDVSDEVITKEATNQSLTRREDHFDYYRSLLYTSKDETAMIWSQLRQIPENNMLSSSHRRAMTVELKFDFPFYGHYVRNVTVATGGFLYTGEYVHSWLAATQYIAPLMANFDTSISDDSFVRLQDNGTAFTVVWENVTLQDKPDFGKFTFSVTLHQSGDIVFVYYQLPTLINNIQDSQHPVKVGLSDAYIVDKMLYFAHRKTIYEYHRVTFGQQEINNSTIVMLTALPTCLGYNDCEGCLKHNTTFECAWCPALNRCSTHTGNDRRKQEWMQKGCERTLISSSDRCPALGQRGNNAGSQDSYSGSSSGSSNNSNKNNSSGSVPSSTPLTNSAAGSAATESTLSSTQAPTSSAISSDGRKLEKGDNHDAFQPADNKNVGVAFGFMVPICLVCAITLWLFYAYRNPHTRSGQLLIQFRPSQWSWRRGEARYTAATIHM